MATIKTSIDNGVLTIVTEGQPDIRIDPDKFPRELVDYAALHGFKQRICDAAALSVVDGRRPTAGEKYAEMRRLVDHMETTGEWKRTGGGEGGAGSDGLLVRALTVALGIDLETARATVAGWDKPTQTAMRQDPEIAPIIARLRVAKAPAADVAEKVAAAKAGLAALRRTGV